MMTDEPLRVDAETPDLAAEKLAQLQELFPGTFADGVVDAARIGELVGMPVAGLKDGRERYGLMWAGKQEAVASLLKPSRGTLVPDMERSIDFENARNVFIEGDNLEVLKILQKSYNDQVKLIYIDPPYNTGNDFVYIDDLSDGLRGYLEYTGQVDSEGKRTSAIADKTGRKHSGWLSMMYPRLALARNLLRRDGVIAVSIDANEVHQLKLVLDEVFGSENYLNTMVWVSNLKGRQISDGGAAGTHEYILIYARSADNVGQFRGSFSELRTLMPSVYKGAGYELKHDAKGAYVTKNELYNTNSKFNELTAPTMVFKIHFNPSTEEVRVSDLDDETEFPGYVTAMPHANARPDVKWHAWRWSRAKVLSDTEDLEFLVTGNSLRIWSKVRDVDGVTLKDLVIGPSTTSGQSDLDALGLARVFDTPKPVDLLRTLVSAVTSRSDLILDFFAGSGSTAHAVLLQNSVDGSARRVISVNLPEPTPAGSAAARSGLTSVSDITYARLRAVMNSIESAQSAGLRVLSLSESSFVDIESRPDLVALVESSLRSDAAARDIAQEVLLREGVRLDRPWATTNLGGAERFAAGGVTVVTDLELNEEAIDAAIESNPRVLVFLEDAFAGKDALKASAFYACKQAGVTMKTV